MGWGKRCCRGLGMGWTRLDTIRLTDSSSHSFLHRYVTPFTAFITTYRTHTRHFFPFHWIDRIQ
nr:hypothetical protein I308_06056 [Cryptococcus tetragattii IND107]